MAEATVNQNTIWVIGVGASAGGLEALSSFVRSLPKLPHVTVVIAQHLAPHSKSMMVELLSRQTELPIVPVRDELTIEGGTIYIVPPNHDATFEGKVLRLTKAGMETRPKPSVDTLFHSLAQAWGAHAVGIVLSGTGSDGADGVRAIKEAGGIVLAQDNESAKYDGMPRSAQDTGLIDAVMPPEQMGAQITEILKTYSSGNEVPPDQSPQLRQIIQYLKEANGSDFSQYKMSTITRRIEKRMASLCIQTLGEYYQHLQKDSDELGALAQEMLVSVTSFFRDAEAFRALEPYLEKIILEKNPAMDELRIWVAGCATGEEAYSLAILANEFCKANRRQMAIKIFATDLDQEAIAQARQGLYSEKELGGLQQNLRNEYFVGKEGGFEAKKFLRDMIVFARQNLIQNPPFVKLDLVSCRNVLIYFEAPLQQRVFNIFQYALKPGGILFLGKSENAPSGTFETLDRKAKIFRRLNRASVFPGMGKSSFSMGRDANRTFDSKVISSSVNLAEVAPRQLLNNYRLSAVVTDEEGVILHIIGDLSRYVTMPSGSADFRLTNLLSRTVSTELSVLMRKAKKVGKPQRSRVHIRRDSTSKKRGFAFVVRTLDGIQDFGKTLFLISFETRKAVEVKAASSKTSLKSGDVSTRIFELEQELATTREHLQTLVEELEVSNEELQSLNEELSSTNEELQASNEELETTNEELQSTNEELVR